ILMRRPGIAINAAMLAATIRIDAGPEADIGAIVCDDDGSRGIAKEKGRRRRTLLCFRARVRLALKQFEAIGRIVCCPTAPNRFLVARLIPHKDSVHKYRYISSRDLMSRSGTRQENTSFHWGSRQLRSAAHRL